MVTKDGEAGTMSVQSSMTHSLVSLAANVNGVNGAKATWTGKIGWQRKALKCFFSRYSGFHSFDPEG